MFRLTNGDNLVAKIHRSTDDKYYLERPMKITSIIANDPTDPTGMFKRELVYLIPWMEYTNDIVVPVQKSFVVSMCVADSEISTAYDVQKEREDTGGGDDINMQGNLFGGETPDDPTKQPDDDNILGKFLFEDGEFVEGDRLDITDMSIKDIVNNILDDIISNSQLPPEEWDENNIDKTRNDYGNNLDDWSPYIKDYIIDSPQDDIEKDSEES